MPSNVWDEITYPSPNINGTIVDGTAAEIWEWIRNFIPYYIIGEITYLSWDQRWAMLVKGATDIISSNE